MPSFNLGALGAATDPVPVGPTTWTFAIGGTFTGTVQMQWRSTPAREWEVISLSSLGGAPANYTVPTGAIAALGSDIEPDAQVRGVMTAYTSGTATVRIGR